MNGMIWMVSNSMVKKLIEKREGLKTCINCKDYFGIHYDEQLNEIYVECLDRYCNVIGDTRLDE